MLARLQRAWLVVLLALAIGAGGWALSRGAPWWTALLLMLVVALVHAIALALEFVLLARVEPGAGAARPGAGTLLRAWWGEVWTDVKVFGWRQPFRAMAIPDAPPDDSTRPRRPVLLMHGFVCNRGLWNPWMERLSSAGVPFVAVNLEPVFGSIDAYVPIVEGAIRQLEEASAHKPLIVAHSMGGLAARAWMARHAGETRVQAVLTIGSPHAGTLLAHLGLSRNVRQMRRGSPWLLSLQAQESPAAHSLFTCYFSHCDNIVVPASTATLPGADNRHLPGMAHVQMVFQKSLLDDVIARTIV